MFAEYDARQLEKLVADQASLARLALSPDVRAMHLELEALYRSQLVCALTSAQLYGYSMDVAGLQLAA